MGKEESVPGANETNWAVFFEVPLFLIFNLPAVALLGNYVTSETV